MCVSLSLYKRDFDPHQLTDDGHKTIIDEANPTMHTICMSHYSPTDLSIECNIFLEGSPVTPQILHSPRLRNATPADDGHNLHRPGNCKSLEVL